MHHRIPRNFGLRPDACVKAGKQREQNQNARHVVDEVGARHHQGRDQTSKPEHGTGHVQCGRPIVPVQGRNRLKQAGIHQTSADADCQHRWQPPDRRHRQRTQRQAEKSTRGYPARQNQGEFHAFAREQEVRHACGE